MKLKNIFIIIVLACCASCASKGQKSKTSIEVLTIKSTDNGKTIEVKNSQEFNVLFEKECVGCREIWHITKSDETIVKSVKDSFSNPSCTNCTGGNQDHTFQFKAVKAGNTILAFDYMEEHFQVSIFVK